MWKMNEMISMVKKERDSGGRYRNHAKMWLLAEYINIYFYVAENEGWDSRIASDSYTSTQIVIFSLFQNTIF